ncbi:MAG TPA: type II toxin-antitoxin system prevent-host-death family antitoxin [Solirubrobacterales bacterium]|nr:type II toxin-antitoxin system prevent-host-death family antitoxin [Solirubrobacterales bacterium]HMU26848.1 type II toxin-antitoxin system prevent-host-death family antitoxin [Solirubrobacterales bacterium]HMX70538.1 type II toxin-antitoxin system prevent-host-death family antitoxin [Solirubrobacterales bacterium]HMY25140.1 type II toxin-antitoxin system prevent-host-death family antitoxin [Solirubrobacterales bacterium]HNA23196.1 type II toxin-antitoxin system prevent-host-death family ant
MPKVGVRELRQNLSRHLQRVKAGESLEVTEHGRVVARLSPAGENLPEAYLALAADHGAQVPSTSLSDLVANRPRRATPAGTVDAMLAEGRAERS